MRKRLISILIANVLFMSNVGFTSLAIEQNMDDPGIASSVEEAEETDDESEEESQEASASDSYFDDVEYVKIQSFTELPEEIINQKLKMGGSLEEINFPESLEITVVEDFGRDARIREQLGKERELIRELEEEEAAEAASSASSEDEELEEEEGEEGEGSSQIIDGEEIFFFDSDSDEAVDQSTAEAGNEDENQDFESIEDNSNESGSGSGASTGSTISAPAEEPAPEETSPEPESEPANEDQGGSDESSDAPEEAPADSGNEDSGEDNGSSDDLIGKIISVFKPLMVRAAEDVEEPTGNNDEEPAEDAEASDEDEAEGEADESGEGGEADDSYYEDDEIIEDDADEIESIEMVSGIEWILDPARSDADTFSSDVIDQKFVFVPVLVIPDYYYIEAELPTITVTIVEEYFAFDEIVTVDDVKIRVRADEGVFPEGATLFAQKLEEEDEKKVQDKVEEQLEEDTRIVKAYTFDIQIRDKDGKEIEPDTDKGRVFVSFETEEVSNEDYDAEIYHIIESEDANAYEDGSASVSDSKSEDAESNEKSEDADGAEDVDASEESASSETSDDAADDEKASIDGEFTIKKLEAEVVEGEEEKALEAETDGFSAYTIVFTYKSGIPEYPLDKAIIDIKKIIANTILYEDTDGDDQNDKDETDVDPSLITDVKLKNSGKLVVENDCLFVDRLNNALSSYNDIDDATQTGQYTDNPDDPQGAASGDYYLIVKRPYSGNRILAITYGEDINGKPITYDITVANNSTYNEVTWENNNYPYATELGTNKFGLAVKVKQTNNAEVLYQWQYSADNKTYTDISGANCQFYRADKKPSDKKNYWYRCCVNGTPSNPVQIITPNSDTRNWTGYYNENSNAGNQCYVSNGKVAYTIDKSKGRFDVAGEFTISGATKMYQTTDGAKGWSVYCDVDADASNTTPFDDMDLMVSFDKGKPSVLHFSALLKAGYDDFAIAGVGKIGTFGKHTAIAERTAASSTSVYVLASLAVAAADKESDLQDAINKGQGDTVPSFVITPVTRLSNTYPEYYLGTGTPAAYFYNDTEMVEQTIPGVAVGWENVSGSTVDFDFVFAGAATNDILDKVSKVGISNSLSGSSTAIKSVKLSGNTLQNYAYTLGDVDETVEVKLTFKSTSSNSSISSMLPTTSTTSTSTSSSSSSSSSSSGKYTANYFDASLTYKNEGKQVYDDVFQKDKQELPVVLTMEVDYNFDDKEDIHVYRYHDSSASELSEGSGGDGRYKIDKSAGKIYIYASNFSTFGVAYKPVTYYTVTFDNGTSTSTVKVKAGEKVAKPETDPTKEGYVFKGWYLSGSSSSSSSSSSTTSKSSASSTATAYNFDTPVTANIKLVAGWTSLSADLEASKAAAMDDEENDSRAPRTGDDLPVVWLWVLLLVAGVTTFGLSAREIANASQNPDKPKKRSKLQVYLLLAGILIKTTVKFIARKIKENRAKALLGLSTAVILVSCIVLASTLLQYHKSESIYSDADITYVDEGSDEEVDEYVEEIKELAGEEPKFDWWDCAQVNIKELKEEYPEVVGWIYFENENISYPIMYSGDNDKYLKTTYTGAKAKAGAIFIDGESTPDFTDPHSLIYGHNMRDLSMFGRLRYYMTTPGYYDDHQYFQIFTEDKVYRYQIFAYEEVADNHDVFWVFGKEPTGYYKMLKEIERGSYCNSGITTNESDHVITLATCTNKDDERLIVSAVRTDEYDYAQ